MLSGHLKTLPHQKQKGQDQCRRLDSDVNIDLVAVLGTLYTEML